MFSALFFGGGGNGGGGGGGDGGGVSKLKADRRSSSSSSWTTLFSRRNSSAVEDEHHRQHHHHQHHHHHHDAHKKKQRASRGLSSSSTLSLALSRPPPVPAAAAAGAAGATASSALKPQKRQPLPSPSSPPSSFPQTQTRTQAVSSSSSTSKKHPAGRQLPSVDSLSPKANSSPSPVVVVGHPTGGYASTKPIRAADPPQLPPPFRHSAFGPALLAQSSLFPKPAAYIYTARSAFSSSTMSLSSSSPPPAVSGAPDPHKRHSKRDRSPSPSRRHSSRRLKSQSTRDFDQPDIGCPELPTPPDSRRATPAHHHRPRESSRNLSTINEDQPERTKSRSKKHRRRHRTPEEKEERERRKRKARDADDERLDEIRRNAEKPPMSNGNVPEAPTRTPPPPPPGTQDQQAPTPRYTTPVAPSRRDSATPATQSIFRSSAANILQAITGSLDRQKGVSSKTSKDRLSGSSPKSSSTRVILQQTDQSTKVKIDLGEPAPAAHRDEGDSTESDRSECHTPKGAEFPLHKLPGDRKDSIHSSPNVKIVGEDVSDDLFHQTGNIDFLLPYGGLQEQFDSGYEIEQDIDEDEFPEDIVDDGTVLAGGSQPPRRKSHAGFPTIANSVLNVDPLSQQLPVLISLIDNTVTAYETILETQGSFAVGIGGYQPVARRLLEKVGKLFSRELPPDAATWGETLEYISGRKEIPELLDCELDDEAVSEFFDHDDEKMFIYNACLEEPEVLDPAIEGLRRLTEEPVTAEETAIYLTTYPHLRPLLLACNAMTDDELDILYSKQAAAFLNVDVAVRSDKQREATECAELSRGIDETVKKMEAIISRMRSAQTNILKRKKGIEAHLAVHAPVDDDTPALAPEIQTAIDEIQNEDIIKMEDRKRRRKELKKELEDEDDDGDTLLPDDSISQINPYRTRRIPQSVARAYQQAQTRAAAAAAAPQVPGSVVSTRTSTSILQEYLAAKAPPRQTQTHGTVDPMMPPVEFDAGQGGGKKMNAYFRVPLPVKIYGSLMNDLKEKVRRFPLHPASSGRNLEAIPERSEVPDTAHYDDQLHRSNSRSSTKVPSSRNLLNGSSSKRSGLFSKKVVAEPHPHDGGGDRSCTPVLIHAPGVGGYGSSKPVLANETNLRKEEKEKERAREKEKRRREKGKSGGSSRRRDSYVERPRK
ncbi:hypothetical protein Dda_5392 [Drechslerella dactyloides]|uniref:Uncharacterized protein n=1 Tax=Drechslerella dactyloides TaxID=74499 RepID=A0AAD6J0F2_DREDA|nr:hypothetical protein Dda_5392 [Drechslerella dactyloides]